MLHFLLDDHQLIMPLLQMCSCEEKSQRDLNEINEMLIDNLACFQILPHSCLVVIILFSYIAANDRSGEESAYRLLRSLCVMIKMSTNPECLYILLQSFTEHLNTFIRILQETSNNRCHSQMATFLHNLLKVHFYLLFFIFMDGFVLLYNLPNSYRSIFNQLITRKNHSQWKSSSRQFIDTITNTTFITETFLMFSFV